MQLAFLLYVASIADNIRSGCTFFIWIFGLAALVSTVVSGVTALNMTDGATRTERWETLRRGSRLSRKVALYSFLSWAALIVLVQLVPSKKDVYIVAGGYVALKAANSEVVQTTSNTMLNSIEHWLDKELTRDARQDAANNTKKGGR